MTGGLLVLEYQPYDLFSQEESQHWQACERSVFSDEPHLWLQEFSWNDQAQAEIVVHWIIDAARCQLSRYAQCHQAYRDEEWGRLLRKAGFDDLSFYPPITGIGEEFEFPVCVGRRGTETAVPSEED